MSIPAWRKVEYTDDGCHIYECLNCYKSWEGRSNPEWDGWKFCPYCSVEWQQQIEDKDDKHWTRRQNKYSKLDHKADIELQIKHYQLDDAGKYDTLLDWEFVSYGMRFHDLPHHSDSDYKEDLPRIYKDYIYRTKVAKKIKEMAASYSDGNPVCDNFFMFTEGYELRIQVTSRMTGENNFIYITDGIEPVIRKHPYPYPKLSKEYKRIGMR